MGSLRVERVEGSPVASLVIDHPERRNAMSAAMWGQFAPLLAELATDPTVSVLVVRGAGENFSAGADISDLGNILTGESDGGVMTEAEDALAAFPKLTIAAIDGHCVGGGWEVAGACDVRVCTERSTFGITPSRLGIVYPRSGIERLIAIAGPAVAKHLLFSGELVSAERALAWGLVTTVLPTAGFADAVAEFAALLSARSQYSIRAMKQIIDASVAGGDVDQIVAHWLATPSEDRAIGVDAFLAKRAPEFTWGTERAQD